MAWIWTPSRPSRRSRSRYYSNDSAAIDRDFDDYDNPYEDRDDYDDDPDYNRAPRRRRSRAPDDDFDGFYDRNGNRINLTIATPTDMLPPTGQSSERPGDWNTYRTRARF